MIDPRPVMTAAAFDEAAAFRARRWWMTGESLIHVPAIMGIEGWNLYDHPGHRLLTPAQRMLMMWSDIVGQVSNGGFTQYCDNYARNLALGVAAVRALEWPELRARFERAMAEQAGDADAPRRIEPVPLTDDPEKWAASRERLIRHLAGQGRRWWQPLTARALAAVEARYEEWELQHRYQTAVFSGELPSGGERLFDFVEPPTVEAEAFDDWFFADQTREESAVHVGRFIRDHRNELHRIE